MELQTELEVERTPDRVSLSKRLVAMCLGPEAGGGIEVREVLRCSPGIDEVEVAVEAASVNPIDLRRAEGYGRRLLSLVGAARFPAVLGNDFAGTVVGVGRGGASDFAVGDRVYGVKPPSRDGSHASHVLVKGAHVRKAPANREIEKLATLPYCFVTMWLAATSAGVTRQNAGGRRVLVHGASGGLGTLALQTLSAWGARATAIANASDLRACLEAGAADAFDRNDNAFARLRGAFDATLNFATWNDELELLSCLREGALGHATTVHPLVQNFDEEGWVGGALRSIRQKRETRTALPKDARNYAWILFRPNTDALSEMAQLVQRGRLSLPIGIQTPLHKVHEAFEHVRCRAGGRALLTP
jgi:NADPH:quinone reductase-like Zn-dependent oxidoreductase